MCKDEMLLPRELLLPMTFESTQKSIKKKSLKHADCCTHVSPSATFFFPWQEKCRQNAPPHSRLLALLCQPLWFIPGFIFFFSPPSFPSTQKCVWRKVKQTECNLYARCLLVTAVWSLDPDWLDVYIMYVRTHNSKVYILLCRWETSAVNNTVLVQ